MADILDRVDAFLESFVPWTYKYTLPVYSRKRQLYDQE